MSFPQLIDRMLHDTVATSLPAFWPELAVCATIVLVLLVRILVPQWKSNGFYVACLGTSAAFAMAIGSTVVRPTEIFSGMLISDGFAVYMRCLVFAAVLLVILLTRIAWTVEPNETTEFYVLMLGAALGMCLMASANHMLVVFLGVEMASVPSYVLVGFMKHRRAAGEAAMKYAVFGAATAGVMLYGISLLCGVLGSAHLPTMAERLAAMSPAEMTSPRAAALALGGLMLAVGLAFKLSAVPFHQWVPDAFEGATAEVGGFLSVASKAAALALLVRLAIGFSLAAARVPDGDSAQPPVLSTQYSVPLNPMPSTPVLNRDLNLNRNLSPQSPIQPPTPNPAHFIAGLIALLAAVTCTFGNLAAYGQTNMKRLLAYSTIAHAGYMLMAVAAAVTLVGSNGAGAREAVAALAFYAAIYLFMNLGAFAGVALLRNELASEEIVHYAGLVRRSPGVAVCLAIILFSLVGLPPLAGFAAKFTVFAALYDAGMLGLLLIGAANTVLSLFYYLRVVRVMLLEPEPSSEPRETAAALRMFSPPGIFCLTMTLPILVFGVWWGGLLHWAEAAASSLFYR